MRAYIGLTAIGATAFFLICGLAVLARSVDAKKQCVQQAIAASRPAEDVLKICGSPR